MTHKSVISVTALEHEPKLDNILDLTEELSNIALDCAKCRNLFKEVILRYKGHANHEMTNLNEMERRSSIYAFSDYH